MHIEYHNGLYIAHIAFKQRGRFKRDGWIWSPRHKKWCTTNPKLASDWFDFSRGEARETLGKYKAGLTGDVALSMAEDSNLTFLSPDGLSYMPFQRAGIAYALKRADTFLGHAVGLGKTVISVGTINQLPSHKKILILCPAYLKINWLREFQKWDVKGLTVGIAEVRKENDLDKYGEPKRKPSPDGKKKGALIKKNVPHYPDTDVVIVHDAVVPLFPQLKKIMWDTFIVDECQYYRNNKAARSKHIWGGGRGTKKIFPIRAKRRMFLSGTPLDKSPSELWVYIAAMDPNGMGQDWKDFVHRYCDAFETHFGLDYTGNSNLEELNFNMREKFFCAPDKVSVLPELPPIHRLPVFLSSDGLLKQIKEETNVIGKLLDEFRAIAGIAPTEDNAFDSMQYMFPDDLGQFNYNDIAEKMSNNIEVAFDDLSNARKTLALAKIPLVVKHVQAHVERGNKVIVWTHHNDVAHELKKHFSDFAFIAGSVPPMRRQAQVDRVQDHDHCRGLVATMGSAGTGFTITAANIAVYAELSYLPSIMDQTEGRIWRIGQLQNCLVEHLVVDGSMDARFVELLQARIEMISKAVGTSFLRT